MCNEIEIERVANAQRAFIKSFIQNMTQFNSNGFPRNFLNIFAVAKEYRTLLTVTQNSTFP